MPDTSKKTMKQANVLYPDSRHAVLGAYGSGFKPQAVKILTPKREEEPELNFSRATS